MDEELVSFDRAALRNILFKRNMQQKELAEKLGITPATLSKYMVGKVTPSIEMINKICQVLEVPFTTFSDYPIITGVFPDEELEDNQLSTPQNNLLPKEPKRVKVMVKTLASFKADSISFQTFAGVIIQNVLDSMDYRLSPEIKKVVVDIIETTFQDFVTESESQE